MTQLIIGVDPGPTPGVVMLYCLGGAVVHVAPKASPAEAFQVAAAGGWEPWVAVERFIVGRGTARKTRGASMETIAQAQAVEAHARSLGYPVQFLPAGAVKPIVTDKRLEAYGVLPHVSGPHQRDAARHAVFMALKHRVLGPFPPA